jgi:HSP20 family molecular chaperone IbpA
MIDLAPAKTLLALVATTALLTGCGATSTGDTRHETVSFDLGDSKSVRVNLRMGGGELNVTSGTAKLMEANFSYNVPEWKPLVEYKAGSGELSLSQPGFSASFGNSVNTWAVNLNRSVPMDVVANIGAGEATLELGGLNLSRVDLNIGAGEMTVDLRGEPKRDYTVQIRGGVGETTVHLPKDVAIAATATKGIGDISVEGLEQRDGVWMNPDRIDAPVTVRVNVSGGVGQINLKR